MTWGDLPVSLDFHDKLSNPVIVENFGTYLLLYGIVIIIIMVVQVHGSECYIALVIHHHHS